ncbi:aspartate--tRNA(Asn) ligase [Candidatus Roizmanbacteria bacterium]|nr:aspartate--tRNA(Asn) ligase [Candidatus Roizmanbacteria bacterium]
MKKLFVEDTINKIGQEVELYGWVHNIRTHKNIIFIDFRDRSGIVQVVANNKFKILSPEDVIMIKGTVNKRPANMVNAKLKTGEIEIQAKEFKILAKAETLPLDLSKENLNLNLPTLLDYRSLTLRHPKISAIFKVQETVIDAFRRGMKEKQFIEFQSPVIIPQTAEGGSDVFEVNYFEKKAFLSQSPQFYKQIMVGVFERVFTVNKTLRAEPSVTTRHLTEVTTLDAEFGFIDSWTELMDMAEYIIKFIFNEVKKNHQEELNLYNTTMPKIQDAIPRIKLREAQRIIYKRTKRDNRNEPDLQPEDEKEICKWAAEEKGSELIFVTHYPASKRPFYTFEDPEDPGYTQSFDLLGRGTEWLTGGRRIINLQTLLKKAKERDIDIKKSELYLQAFRYGLPPEGGYSFGSERIVMGILRLSNIREASLFPRDMERIDVRLSTVASQTKVTQNSYVFQKIKKKLDDANIAYEVMKHKPVYTSEDAAKVRGTELKQGAKALIMFADKKPVMLVLPADRKVDMKKFKSEYKIGDLRMATVEEVRKVTGVEIGAVPPFGNIFETPLYVDSKLGENERISFNAGEHTRSIVMEYKDFEKVAKPIIGDFSI